MKRLGLQILVGIKWVPNTSNVRFDPKTGALIREGVPSIVNPHDLDAVEFALDLRDRYGGEVNALSMAPPSAIEGLEQVLGMGVDSAILVSDRIYGGADTLATSYVLAHAVKRISNQRGKLDLVIFGQETIDSSTAHIAAQTASWLDLPYLYYVRSVEIKENGFIAVERWLEDEKTIYDLPLPAVLGVAMKSREPRPVRLIYKIRAKAEKPIEIVTNEILKLNPNCVGLKGSPTWVSKIDYTPEVKRKREVFMDPDAGKAAKWLMQKYADEDINLIGGAHR
ncbi:MAG TPA: electron transfer flavoprotein subunit beta/FixA family protein [Candidatus Bathyarchaeia archaeon]|nr:MAG: electron transfer flavoprotein subunit beta [Candidatus Bathyarchaeota archaeon RBG_16_48_13]HJX23639.1 electron transfer flavoprotein subunit beta/FixA family protein [Candidatus Bathyarchaeia archaeon]